MARVIMLIIPMILMPLVTRAADYYVAPDGNDMGSGSEADPWQHIQYALDSVTGTVSDQQYIHILPGTYYERLLMGEDDWFESLAGTDPETTIVDAEQLERCLVTSNLYHSEISGLTFQHGKRSMPYTSSGTLVISGEEVAVHDCIVRWNEGLYQAGIFVAGPNEVYNCEIFENQTLDMNGNNAGIYITYPEGAYVHHNYIHHNYNRGQIGAAGITFFFTTATIENNIIENNSADSCAAGVFIRYGDPTFIKNTIRWNSLSDGSAVKIEGAYPKFENNLIVDNETAVGIHVTEGFTVTTPSTFRLNTIVGAGSGISWGNCPAPDMHAPITECIVWTSGDSLIISDTELELSYTCLSDQLFSGLGVIYDDPLFVDPSIGDYHLSSPASPCIDSGNPSSYFCEEPWPNGCRINLGAYGNTDEAELSSVLTCTPTCPTESPIPSETPVSTETPTPESTSTPNEPSVTPTITPGAGGLTMELWLDDTFLSAGERLHLRLALTNAGSTIEFQQYVCLEAYGIYFFYPLWQESPTACVRTLGQGSFVVDTLLDVILPDPLPPDGPFHFYGLLIDPISGATLSDLEVAAFAFV